jgi:hypothetical protein
MSRILLSLAVAAAAVACTAHKQSSAKVEGIHDASKSLDRDSNWTQLALQTVAAGGPSGGTVLFSVPLAVPTRVDEVAVAFPSICGAHDVVSRIISQQTNLTPTRLSSSESITAFSVVYYAVNGDLDATISQVNVGMIVPAGAVCSPTIVYVRNSTVQPSPLPGDEVVIQPSPLPGDEVVIQPSPLPGDEVAIGSIPHTFSRDDRPLDGMLKEIKITPNGGKSDLTLRTAFTDMRTGRSSDETKELGSGLDCSFADAAITCVRDDRPLDGILNEVKLVKDAAGNWTATQHTALVDMRTGQASDETKVLAEGLNHQF